MWTITMQSLSSLFLSFTFSHTHLQLPSLSLSLSIATKARYPVVLWINRWSVAGRCLVARQSIILLTHVHVQSHNSTSNHSLQHCSTSAAHSRWQGYAFSAIRMCACVNVLTQWLHTEQTHANTSNHLSYSCTCTYACFVHGSRVYTMLS